MKLSVDWPCHVTSQVPAAQQAATPIQLMATAGLRIMAASAASAILSSCGHTLAHSTFRFEHSWAFALPGSLEGVYGFLAANYASGALQSAVLNSPGLRKHALAVPDSVPFMGVLELGGASAQVTHGDRCPLSLSQAHTSGPRLLHGCASHQWPRPSAQLCLSAAHPELSNTAQACTPGQVCLSERVCSQ